MRTQSIRSEVQRLLQARPFRPFVLVLENGQQVLIEHPENIAFDPSANGDDPRSNEFYVLSRELRVFSTFAAVTSVALADEG
jgi:hypothetical protein